MEFDWTHRPIAEWRAYLKLVPQANWLQSIPFAKVVKNRDQKATKLALIKHEGAMIGMMAIHEIKLGPIHFLNLYRGPLWFSVNPSEVWFAEFAWLFDQTYPRRLFRKRTWLPEWRDSDFAQTVLRKIGFKSKEKTFETIWLNLNQSEAALRAGLKSKWRNALNKGERSGIEIKLDRDGSTTEAFLRRYESDKKMKGYHGRPAAFIKEEIDAAAYFKEMLIMWAYKDNQPIAGILILMHGHSASYRVGWTTDVGRKCNAHNVLLWASIRILKEKGLHNFDLGGVQPFGAEGVTSFKQGMGGDEVKLVGVFS